MGRDVLMEKKKNVSRFRAKFSSNRRRRRGRRREGGREEGRER
jgi:hypothetical protein